MDGQYDEPGGRYVDQPVENCLLFAIFGHSTVALLENESGSDRFGMRALPSMLVTSQEGEKRVPRKQVHQFMRARKIARVSRVLGIPMWHYVLENVIFQL